MYRMSMSLEQVEKEYLKYLQKKTQRIEKTQSGGRSRTYHRDRKPSGRFGS